MTNAGVTRQVVPHWLMRLFGAEAASFRSADNGLLVESEKGGRYVILVESLANKAAFNEGTFFSSLVLITDKGTKTFRGLRKQEGKALFDWLRACWLTQLAPDVTQAAHEINAILAKGYPRQSRIDTVVAMAKAALSRFHIVPDPDWCPEIDVSPFAYVAKVAQWSKAEKDQLSQQYVAQQLSRYSQFFEKVESKPLTERQRHACIVDEDNNLVLAGAGTGKTSTMVGRAGYLIESGQARPGDILMLAFANKAALEMQERIAERLGNCGVSASTFHKLGKEIIAAVEGKQPSLTPLADDPKMLAWQVNQWFEEHLKNPQYRQITIEYFQYHLYPEANPFDFKSEGEYFDYILANDIRTLKGEPVKSLGECLVANYLFKQGIEYQYEAAYEHDTATALRRQYQPDFYLPAYGVYIEYFGIDRNNGTAPYIDRYQYLEDMAWKRNLHGKKGTRLIELFHYEMMEGGLFASIDRQLDQLGIIYDPLPPEAVLSTLREFGAISQFATLLADLLSRYRANCYEEGQVEVAIAKASNPPQVAAALKLLNPIVDDYQDLLDSAGHIDFDDMIGKAIQYVKEGRYRSKWRFILVDEFQDISDARARLVKYLRDSSSECSLFCVGDDWQAIYRFTGSDLAFTTAFKDKFGTTATTALDLTFRFNDSISETATRFVLQNPAQVKKELKTVQKVDKPAVSLLRADNRVRKSPDEPDRIEQVLMRIAAIATAGSSVYLLGRYGFNLPDRGEMSRLRSLFPQLKIDGFSIHASKGKEADYVVVLGLETGKHGFPSEKVTHPLLEALLPPLEPYKHAEERRLFYVALTRARKRAYLVADMAVASDFVVELLKNNYKVELGEFEASLAQQLFHLIKCMKCKTGTMVARKSQHGSFYGCNKYPLCTHKERGCPTCGMQMHRVGRFKLCINADCRAWVPVCPKCGAEMTKRTGVNGEFWGCRNYRREGECCRHTENEIVFDRKSLSIT